MDEREKRTLLSKIADFLGINQRLDAPEEEKERAMGLSQLFDQLRMQLDNMYGWDHWLLDLFYDADNTPFIVLTSGGKLFRHTVMIEDDTATLGEAIPVMQEFVPTVRTTTTIKRQANGRWRWYSVSASSVLNRVGEIDSRELFDSFEAHSLETGEYPIRQFYHAGEAFRTGEADFLARDGNLYITSGLYDDTEIAEREVKARQKEPDYWGDSIGFLPTKAPEFLEVAKDVSIPVYRAGINKEISTLPEKDAANLFTANTEVLGVRRMLDQRQMDAWIKLFDGDEEAAKNWLEQNAESRNRQIEQNDLITRGLFEAITNKFYEGDKEKAKGWLEENGLTVDEQPQEQETEGQEIVSELSDEDVARALEQSGPVQQMVKTLEAIADKLTENEATNQQRQKQLTDSLQDLATRIEALEADDETKQREWLQNQPRRFNGTTKHIIRPRVARAQENEDEPESFADRAKQNLESKGIPSY